MRELAVIFGGILALVAGPALAEPTEVVVRVLSKDAKFIGTSMGGVRIELTTVTDDKRLLAEGKTVGGTGDTERLVVQPKERHAVLAGEGDAAFRTTLDITEPTLVRVTATGPGKPGVGSDPVAVSTMRWLLPGQKPVGDGWVIEMPGLAVNVVAMPSKETLTLEATVTLMCGCPVTPGGLWNADHYTVTAWIRPDSGGEAVTVPMTYAGEPSTFTVQFPMKAGVEAYSVTVTATESDAGNTGVSTVGVLR
ncbi:hypothetical protein GVN21_12900 [Caulobacter sp. SLTY]|uniref:hypothetical protein n=1 Tax=Caulobacter sp. SLTY TaxID=2683262 RepID=UPI00141248F9|nr:hypothetical protein [Caulobacter sp. SLTY]NBB16258.1 hypothetical protein [Caulobacter sp. SLTY]